MYRRETIIVDNIAKYTEIISLDSLTIIGIKKFFIKAIYKFKK